eukprot:TRINITY_DN9464_c1_g1_i1.p1 TRINITY_DN9464_c1_g1~~TRINITY_DN9464_c1_g1_i1.p1  ORF type:complete len:530 (-),score=229.73 TRINITY_DN9464_c1_g1_i1:34-1551(-)
MKKVNVLMIGTGEYTTGIVQSAVEPKKEGEGQQHQHQVSKSDKKLGVVGVVSFDLRRRGLVDRLLLAGQRGSKMQQIREHWNSMKDLYASIDTEFEAFPKGQDTNPNAYLDALLSLSRPPSCPKYKRRGGEAVTLFTPDDTHYPIAMDVVKARHHLLVTKPPVQTLEQHNSLAEAARSNSVLVAVELHKRWDPIYQDAAQRIKSGEMGTFNFFQSYMSQPKIQLHTFKAWAGKNYQDISYYLNAHHIDFHCWSLEGKSRPVRVVAMASRGIASSEPFSLPSNTEDTISLMVTWINVLPPSSSSSSSSPEGSSSETVRSEGLAIYTSSWSAAKSDVHSQQRFHFMGSKAEIQIDQAHRGYQMSSDANGFQSINPLFMKYTPDPNTGTFGGQTAYGYRSIEQFYLAVQAIQSLETKISQDQQQQQDGQEQQKEEGETEEVEPSLVTAEKVQAIGREFGLALLDSPAAFQTTAVLQAGRFSLDNFNQPIEILYEDPLRPFFPTSIRRP